MNPQNHRNSHFDYFNDLIKGDNSSAESHRKFYDEYNAVLDMDAPYYLDTIRVVFQDFNLVNGTWDVKSPSGVAERVRPQDIRNTALLSVEGELDDISGSGQTEAVHALCTGVAQGHKHHFEAKGAGHYGIFSGRRWRDMVYPQVHSFIAAHTPAARIAQAATPSATPSAPAAKQVAATPIKRAKPATVSPAKKPVSATKTPAATAPVAAAAAARKTVRAAAPVAAPAAPPAAAKKKAPAKRAAR
jgi:poly(3-hydroxybutyrate) depolymerase